MKFFAEEKTLLPSESWKNNIETKRIELVNIELKKNILYKDFKVTSAPQIGLQS